MEVRWELNKAVVLQHTGWFSVLRTVNLNLALTFRSGKGWHLRLLLGIVFFSVAQSQYDLLDCDAAHHAAQGIWNLKQRDW